MKGDDQYSGHCSKRVEFQASIGCSARAHIKNKESLEMAHQVKVPATKPDEPSLTPGTHLVEGEKRLLQIVL